MPVFVQFAFGVGQVVLLVGFGVVQSFSGPLYQPYGLTPNT
jgi:hypothetical protein